MKERERGRELLKWSEILWSSISFAGLPLNWKRCPREEGGQKALFERPLFLLFLLPFFPRLFSSVDISGLHYIKAKAKYCSKKV